MSGFQRFVTYLNLYEDNQKIRNTGFAKIEKKNEQCKVEIHMKGAGYTGINCPVYLYTRQNNKLMGVSIGELQIQNGNANFQTVLTSTNLNQSGYNFDQINGMIVTISDKFMIASQWDDKDINRKQFIIVPKKNDGEAEPEKKENTLKAAEQPIREKNAAAKEINQRAEKTENEPVENAQRQSEQPQRQAKIQQMPQRNRCPKNNVKVMEAARKLEPEENITNNDTNQNTNNEEKTPAWEQKWQFIMENYPVMTPFEGEENILCVRLELKDIRILPKRYWYLGNNSFLLHGFFNYRFLLLGAMEDGDKKKWFIGVPGVYQSQEKVMSTLFGFPEFKCEKTSEHKTGQFGYWFRLMDE